MKGKLNTYALTILPYEYINRTTNTTIDITVRLCIGSISLTERADTMGKSQFGKAHRHRKQQRAKVQRLYPQRPLKSEPKASTFKRSKYGFDRYDTGNKRGPFDGIERNSRKAPTLPQLKLPPIYED
jgi:hypothetical protein